MAHGSCCVGNVALFLLCARSQLLKVEGSVMRNKGTVLEAEFREQQRVLKEQLEVRARAERTLVGNLEQKKREKFRF